MPLLEVYADVVFLINFSMDFLIFYITARLMKKRVRILRILGGAIFAAAAYCLFIFLVPFIPVLNAAFSVFILFAGVFIAFSFSFVKEFLKTAAMCYIVAFAMGGTAMALFYYLNITDFMGIMVNVSTSDVSVKILIAASALSFLLYKLIFHIYKRFFAMQKSFLDVVISFNGKNSTVHTLVDTGNELCDPVSRSPVIVVEFGAIQNLLSDKACEIFLNHLEDNLPELLIRVCDSELSNTIRMIPFQSLGREHGMLIGFKPDCVHIFENEDKKRDFVIAVYNGKLGDGYNALCPQIN